MNASEVRKIVEEWLAGRITGVNLGLPEKDDRKDVWRVALVNTTQLGTEPVGEVRVLDGKDIFSTNLPNGDKNALSAPCINRSVNRKISRFPFAPTFTPHTWRCSRGIN